MRWGVRLIGLFSTVIVARLLVPADYGLIAMASLVMTLVQVFIESDAGNALLREPNASEAFQHSTWTIRFLQSLVLALVISLAAPLASAYFREPRLEAVIWVFAVSVVVEGLSGLGPLLARKDLSYGSEVKILLASRVVNLVVTVGLALAWRNYWALVLGAVSGSFTSTALSYLLHPYRPRIDFSHTRAILGFSQWMILTFIGTFAARKVDGFVVGRIGSAADLGSYNVGMELGQMVTAELGSPLSRALLPVLSTLHADPPRMRAAVMKTTAAMNTITLPAGIGLAAVAPVLVPVVLGPNWTSAVPILIAFAMMGAVRYLSGPYFALFMAEGRSRILAMMAWIEFAAFGIAVAFLFQFGVLGVVYARGVATVIIVSTWLVLGHVNGLRLPVFFRVTWRPVLSCLLMVGCIVLLPVDHLRPVVQLALMVPVGALVYVASIWCLWLAVGKPDGFESQIGERVKALVANGRWAGRRAR